MKQFFMLLMFLTAFQLSSCNKDDSPEEDKKEEEATAILSIQVIASNGSAFPEAEVQLYTTQADYFAKSNSVSTKNTDQSGYAVFEKLKPVQYWWSVEKDGMTNVNSSHWTGAALKNGQTLEKITQIR